MSTASVTPRGGVAAALTVVYIAWGSTFVAMRVAVRSLPPLTMSGVRFLAAGLLLNGWYRWQRHRHPEAGWRAPTRREWRASAILGIALPGAGTGGAAWVEQKIPAGTAALLLATVPVWMIITSRIVDNERITFLTAGGLVLGLAGVAVLINPLAGAAPDLLASAVALGGALCWGCGSVYAKPAPHPGQPLLASGMEMICAGVALGLIGAAGGELGRVSAASLASASGLAFGYLIVFGSPLGYSTYEWLLHHASSQLASTYAFVCPLVAVILGWWLLGEQISGRTLLAAAISVGVALIMLHPRKPEPGRDETGDQPRKPPAARVPAPTRHPRKRPAGNAPSGSEHEPGTICCCDTPPHESPNARPTLVRSSRETPTHDGAAEVTAAPGKRRDSEIPPSQLALSLDCQNVPSGLKQGRPSASLQPSRTAAMRAAVTGEPAMPCYVP
jgi:drug/metabolite transporter (DMT)-like permease